MLNALTIEQRQLADFMSHISEKCYYAGWLKNIEYVLWHAVINGERKFGHGIISLQDIDKLVKLSKTYNCWIYFDDKTEETAIELSAWRQRFDEAISQNPEIIKS